MRFYVYHWMGSELSVPGVFQEGEPPNKSHSKPHWIEIPEEELGKKLLELSKICDIMLLAPKEKGKYDLPNIEQKYHRLYLDHKGGRFRTR